MEPIIRDAKKPGRKYKIRNYWQQIHVHSLIITNHLLISMKGLPDYRKSISILV